MNGQTLELTEEQRIAVERINDWYWTGKKQTLTLGGFAGVGKTTVIKAARNRIDEAVEDGEVAEQTTSVCAFTGKACSVLRKKGVDADTMHSIMYTCYEDPKTHEMIFSKRAEIDGEPDLVIVDEASMVSTELNNDLLSFGKKVLYVGDPGQLEPIGDNPGVMNHPEILLTKIHRQAEQSRIIQQSIKVRLGQQVDYQRNDEIWCAPKADIPMSTCLEVDQVICGYNKARDSINEQMRSALGYKGLVNVGEKLICLRNDRRRGIYNGLMLKVTKNHGENPRNGTISLDFEDDLGCRLSRIPVLVKGLQGGFNPKTDRLTREQTLFDYGYCITCHKSQGSEWDSVLVFEQSNHLWSMSKWRYTAITRAAKRLIYVR